MRVIFAGYQSGSKSRFTEKVVPQEGDFFVYSFEFLQYPVMR
jgi:hypothetical protein